MKQYISGKNSVLEAIENKVPLKNIYVTEHKNIDARGVNIIVTSSQELDKMVKTNHQGYVAEVAEYNYYSLEDIFNDKPEKVLILDHIQDPQNLGAIMRSANASGLKHIIIPKDRAAKVTASALKVSSGGYVDLKIIRVDSLQVALKKLKESQFWIYSTTLEKDSVELKHASFNYPLALVMGNEAKGVSSTLNKMADQKIFIPMKGSVQSLNVSVATGIMLFSI